MLNMYLTYFVFLVTGVLVAESVKTRKPLNQYPADVREVIEKCGLVKCHDPYNGGGCKKGCKCSPKPNYATIGMCTIAGKKAPSSLYDEYQHLTLR